jgi:hypothetical protein
MRLGAIGDSRVGTPSPLVAAAALVLALGCRARFEGPYPCEKDFASCVDPSQNLCETNTSSDGLNCGACGTMCDLGAACVASRCGQAAVTVAPLAASDPTNIETNASAVFWHGATSIFMLPASAGPGATPTTIAPDFLHCNSTQGAAFGVDDANVYYFSDGSTCGGINNCGGLVQVSLADKTRTVLVAPTTTGNSNFCGSFAVGPTAVYLLVSQQQGSSVVYTVFAAQIGVAGQTVQTVATAQSYNNPSTSPLAINSTSLFFETSGANNSPALQVVPLDGGKMTALPLDINTYGFGVPFAVDDANVYAVAGGCPCNGNSGGNQSTGAPPVGRVARISLHGGPSTTLATFSGEVGGVVVDGTDVYWSTDTTAWRVPVAGGAARAVAGNLSNGIAPFKCVGCGGGGNQNQGSAIAVTASGVYVAVTGTNENAVLEVAK